MNRFSCLIAVLAMSRMLLADLVPVPGSQKVRPVFEASDVVCSGRVESLRVLQEKEVQSGDGALHLKRVLASVYVQDVYKANESLPSSIVVSFDEQGPEVITHIMPILEQNERAILFLKHSQDSTYVFADRFLGVTSFASIPTGEGRSGFLKLQSTLAEIVHENGREDKINAMQLLDGMENLQPGTLAQITPLITSQDPELAFNALAIMIKARAPGSLELLIQYLKGYQGDGALFPIANIGGDLNEIRNREDLSALESLTSSRLLAIRLGSMEAIRNIGAASSAPTLIQRLSDSDSTIRYIAVITLSEIFNQHGDYKPSMAEFRKRPDFYTKEWKDWWAHEGAALQTPASR
ncbi:MAG: hypothetical protein WAM85_13145 [Terracidiphilus sp.]